mgnify:CR=1 FL=1
MREAIESDGVFVVPEYISGDPLKKLHDEVYGKCSNEAGHYEFGRNYRGPALSSFPKKSAISQSYDSSWMKNLYTQYSGNRKGYGRNVFATHDYKFTGTLARNGWLHFDRIWAFKFFIYLTDIDQSCGAFHCSVGSHKKGKELRKKAWRTKSYDSVKNRIELNYPDLLEVYPSLPVEAAAGSLIVFDTDTFHKGGQVLENKERLVVRLHCGV